MGKRIWLFLVLVIVAFAGCQGEEMEDKEMQSEKLGEVSSKTWKELSNVRVFFGHKSVGMNIIDGLKDLIADNPQISLKIVNTRDGADLDIGTFAHASTGHNMDFQSKIDDFQTIINEEISGNVDIAFQKFCYIDFDRRTDSEKRFATYEASVMELKRQHPNIKFIHTTIPLVALQSGPKAWIKKLLGKSLDGTDDNVKRGEYNELLRKTFQGGDPIIDIARAESTYPDGSRELSSKDGKQYEVLISEYTDDGGHLNEFGRCQIAMELLLVLVDVISKPPFTIAGEMKGEAVR